MFQTEPGVVLGTVAYMSPEQARGLPVDARTDIFSLGVVLYEMVTDHAPFMGETPSDMIVSILDREPPPLARHLPDASPEIQRVVSRALAKNMEERYRNVKEMAVDLRRLKQRAEFEAEMGRTTQFGETSPAVPAQTAPRRDEQNLQTKIDNDGIEQTLAAEDNLTYRDRDSTPEIAHVLFMDIVGYSKQVSGRQRQMLQQLNLSVRSTEDFRRAQAAHQLISRATGDGMALVFFGDPEAPVRCALQLSRALRAHPNIELRMGIHTGLVYRDTNIAGERDVTGRGINYRAACDGLRRRRTHSALERDDGGAVRAWRLGIASARSGRGRGQARRADPSLQFIHGRGGQRGHAAKARGAHEGDASIQECQKDDAA